MGQSDCARGSEAVKEGEVQRNVIEALKKMGWWVARIQCGKVKVRGGWMQLAPDGTADLLAIKGLRTVWIEAKRLKGGKHSDVQKDFESMVKRAGHSYLMVRSLEDVTRVLA